LTVYQGIRRLARHRLCAWGTAQPSTGWLADDKVLQRHACHDWSADALALQRRNHQTGKPSLRL